MVMSGRSRIDDIRRKSKKWKSEELLEYQTGLTDVWTYNTRLKYYGIIIFGLCLIITIILGIISIVT